MPPVGVCATNLLVNPTQGMYAHAMKPSSPVLPAIVLIALLALQASAAGFRAGMAVRLVTPDPRLPLSGGVGPSAPASGDLRRNWGKRLFSFREQAEPGIQKECHQMNSPSVNQPDRC